jgi:hypothetical protein
MLLHLLTAGVGTNLPIRNVRQARRLASPTDREIRASRHRESARLLVAADEVIE